MRVSIVTWLEAGMDAGSGRDGWLTQSGLRERYNYIISVVQ